MSQSQITVKGSCLCGSVQYEVTGETKRFYHCHCERCRKATGTGHASNLLIIPQTSISWLQGEELLARHVIRCQKQKDFIIVFVKSVAGLCRELYQSWMVY